MKDLTSNLQSLYSIKNLDEKKEAAYTMIAESHAKDSTKVNSYAKVSMMRDIETIDGFMTNFMLSGEVLKVTA